VAIAYTIRYGRENSTVAVLFPVSDEESLISSDGGSVSTTGGTCETFGVDTKLDNVATEDEEFDLVGLGARTE